MEKVKIEEFETADALARAAAAALLDELGRATRSKPFCIALSGGRIAKSFFAQTAEQARARELSFQQAHFFWADERCVPPDHEDSNFRLAEDSLLAPLSILPSQVHRIRGELGAEAAARLAETDLRAVTGSGNGQPILDLVILGMGEDGHVASLFPGDACEPPGQTQPAFRPIHNAPKPPPDRVTLSYGIIIAARLCWVLVSGEGKRLTLKSALTTGGATPLGQVLARRGSTRIFSAVGEL